MCLVLARAFESNLFYDPLLQYFKNDYLYKPLPKVDTFKILINLFLRFILNTLISLLIIYLAFFKKRYVILASKIYTILFIVLILLYFLLIEGIIGNGYLMLFYVRRFLIQPLILLILLPVFYMYQQQLTKDCN